MWSISWLTAVALWAGSSASPVDVSALIREARQVQQEDLAIWNRLTFKRRVVRERLDSQDALVSEEVLDFLITPKGQSVFDEKLVRVDGRSPSPSEVREHRRARRFEKRYRTAFVGEASEYEKGDFSLAHFMTRTTYRYGGVEEVDGVRCHRLDFPAEDKSRGRGVAQRLSAGTEGTLWLETEGLHAIRARSRLVRPISAMLGLVKVQRVEIEMSTLGIDQHRLPSEIVVTTTSVVAGREMRKRNRFIYSDHRPLAGAQTRRGSQ